MLAVLSPAKTLDFSEPTIAVAATEPALLGDALVLNQVLRAFDPSKLERLMKVRGDKAKRTHVDIARFGPQAAGLPSAFAYSGEVFRGLRAREMSATDLAWAQDRIAVLSGLYGLLRPLDEIQAHRLEMQTRLHTPRGHNLYTFWGDRITKLINGTVADHADRTLVNLASAEYFKAIWPRSLSGRVLDVTFENWKDAARTPNTISTPSRHARGLMARFIVEARIERADDLRDFDRERYSFVPERSSSSRFVFGRMFTGA